jgi:hypothetical protein
VLDTSPILRSTARLVIVTPALEVP